MCDVQWVSWPSHVRTDPLTSEGVFLCFKCEAVPSILLLLDCCDLRADLDRQRRILQNTAIYAAIIQTKDREGGKHISAASASAVVENPHQSTSQDILGE